MAKQVADYEFPEGTSERTAEVIATTLWVLHELGPVSDENGRAVSALRERIEEYGAPSIAPTQFSALVRSLCDDEAYGGYVERDINATRTYSVGLAKGKVPGKVPFPPRPWPTDDDDAPAAQGDGLSADEMSDLNVAAVMEAVDAARDGSPELYDLASQIAALSMQLSVKLAAALPVNPNGQPGWIKELIEENQRLREENAQLTQEQLAYDDLRAMLKGNKLRVVST